MILESLDATPAEFERASGWSLKPEGACRHDRCIPLRGIAPDAPRIDVSAVAEQLGMPIVSDAARGLHALGPAAGGHVLGSAECPEISLPDLDGREFSLSSLRGRKLILVAWASW